MMAIGDGANDSARSAVNYGDQRLVPGSNVPRVSRISILHMDLHLVDRGGHRMSAPDCDCIRAGGPSRGTVREALGNTQWVRNLPG